MCTTSDVFDLPRSDREEESQSVGCDLANALSLNLSLAPSSLVDDASPPPPQNTPCDYLTTTYTTVPLPTYNLCVSSQQRSTTSNAPNKDSTKTTLLLSSSSSHQASSNVFSSYNATIILPSANFAAVGNGDRQKPYKGSRIPPGVRPWLSQKLEQMLGIDGKVYSHYILSVLIDGVDNEFFIDDSDLEDFNRSPKTRLGSKRGNEKLVSEEEDLRSDDSFEARRKAVLNYLSSFSLDEDEIYNLVDELISRLGIPALNFPPRNSRQVQTQKRVKGCGRKCVRNLGRGRSLSSGVANQNALLKAERIWPRAIPNRWNHAMFLEKRKERSELILENRRKRNMRPRFASLDDCRYVVPLKNLSKGAYSSKLSGRDTINEEDVYENCSRYFAHSLSSDLAAGPGEIYHGGTLRACSIASLVDMFSCVSTEPDEESCFDFDVDFNSFQIEDHPDYNETYNEAFPALLGDESQEPKATLGNVFISGSLATQESVKTLPPNPVARGQPIWSTKVKAPIGRPLNRRYFDAQASCVITEEVTTVDEASQTVIVRCLSRTADDQENRKVAENSSEAPEVGTELLKPGGVKSASSRLISSSDYDFDLSILNMVGITPEKLEEKRNIPKTDESDCFGSSLARCDSTISKCLKDLFCNKEQGACGSADVQSDLFSPEISKIWDNESLQQSDETNASLSKRCNSADGKESACDSNTSDKKSAVRKVSGTFTNDSVWMPTEEELSRLSPCGLLPSTVKALSDDQESSNDDNGYPGNAVGCELVAGFPGLIRDDNHSGCEAACALVYDNDDKSLCSDDLCDEFSKDALSLDEKQTCSYFDGSKTLFFATYNPRFFDLLDPYSVKENLTFEPSKSSAQGIFGLGSFFKKRDMYFDEFFAENFGSASESNCALPLEELHPVLTEHFLMEIMKFNENTQISTPVSSELDGSLFDDKASEVTTTLQQRASSLIQKLNASNSENVSSMKPRVRDVAMQTDDISDEEHRFSPVHSSSNATAIKDTASESKQSQLELGGKENEESPLSSCSNTSQPCRFFSTQNDDPVTDAGHEVKESEESQKDANDTAMKKTEDVTDLVNSFECPAGCKNNEEASSQCNVPEENLLISPKTHFRPISAQSIESECGYEEKLIIQQTLDGIPVPNTLQLASDTKDSRLFSSWCQNPKTHNFQMSTEWQPVGDLQNPPGTSGNSPWKPGQEVNDCEDDAWKSGVLRDVNSTNATCWNDQFKVFPANSGPLVGSGNNLNTEDSCKFEIPSFINDEIDENSLLWTTETDKNDATSDWLTLPTNQFANMRYEFATSVYETNAIANDEDLAIAQVPVGSAEYEELEFVFDHELMATGSYEGVVHAPTGFQTEYPVGFLPMETLEDVNCKCLADLPGESGIDPLCTLHGGGAAIYLTTATGDSNSVASGGDWSMGSNCSLSALPPTTAINPNVLGFQPPIGSSRNKKKKSVLAANSILPIDESLVSQKQKQKQKQRKKKKSTSNSTSGGGGERENKCADKPCSYFLEGACHRLDCKFSHDLASIPCRFFAEGACFKSYFCPFSHALPTASSVPTGTTIGELIAVPVKTSKSLTVENSTEMKSCSFDSAAEILFVTKDDPITSDSDSVAGIFGTPDVDIVTTLGKGPPRVCKRKRARNGSKQVKQKPVPNITDKAEFPILPNEKGPIKCDVGNDTAVQLSLKSIYPKEGFGSIKSEAVV